VFIQFFVHLDFGEGKFYPISVVFYFNVSITRFIVRPTLSLSVLTVCLILLPLNCFSSSVYGQSEEFSNYENAKFGYKIQYPKSWHVFERPDANTTFFKSSDNSVSVGVSIIPTHQTFERFSSGLIHNMTSLIRGLNELTADSGNLQLISTVETDRATLSGMDAWKMTSNSGNFTSYLIWTVKNNYVYTIKFSSDHVNGIVYEPVFQKMVNSFVIK
jgi:hypothetical protein